MNNSHFCVRASLLDDYVRVFKYLVCFSFFLLSVDFIIYHAMSSLNNYSYSHSMLSTLLVATEEFPMNFTTSPKAAAAPVFSQTTLSNGIKLSTKQCDSKVLIAINIIMRVLYLLLLLYLVKS